MEESSVSNSESTNSSRLADEENTVKPLIEKEMEHTEETGKESNHHEEVVEKESLDHNDDSSSLSHSLVINEEDKQPITPVSAASESVHSGSPRSQPTHDSKSDSSSEEKKSPNTHVASSSDCALEEDYAPTTACSSPPSPKRLKIDSPSNQTGKFNHLISRNQIFNLSVLCRFCIRGHGDNF